MLRKDNTLYRECTPKAKHGDGRYHVDEGESLHEVEDQTQKVALEDFIDFGVGDPRKVAC
jgi:hypothetical protein